MPFYADRTLFGGRVKVIKVTCSVERVVSMLVTLNLRQATLGLGEGREGDHHTSTSHGLPLPCCPSIQKQGSIHGAVHEQEKGLAHAIMRADRKSSLRSHFLKSLDSYEWLPPLWCTAALPHNPAMPVCTAPLSTVTLQKWYQPQADCSLPGGGLTPLDSSN
jgi:hypothetical protein